MTLLKNIKLVLPKDNSNESFPNFFNVTYSLGTNSYNIQFIKAQTIIDKVRVENSNDVYIIDRKTEKPAKFRFLPVEVSSIRK